MDISELISSRRSIRKYRKKSIPREQLEKCALSARMAPSACNSQPWRFVIVDDHELKDRLAREAFGVPPGINSFVEQAAAIVAVISRREKLPAQIGEKLRGTSFRKIDTGIATSHFVLRAWDLGIGSCILGWFNERKVKKALNVPRGEKVELLISLGYPEESALSEKHLRPASETIFFNDKR